MSACMSGTRGSGVLSSTGDVLVTGCSRGQQSQQPHHILKARVGVIRGIKQIITIDVQYTWQADHQKCLPHHCCTGTISYDSE